MRVHQFIGHITSARPREGAPAAFPFICLLSSVTAEFRPSVSVDFCFDVCFVAGSAVISTSSQGSCQWRQRKILVATKFRKDVIWYASILYGWQIERRFCRAPFTKCQESKNAGSSRCFPTEWLQAFRQQCLICEFFHPCFDECRVLFLLSVSFFLINRLFVSLLLLLLFARMPLQAAKTEAHCYWQGIPQRLCNKFTTTLKVYFCKKKKNYVQCAASSLAVHYMWPSGFSTHTNEKHMFFYHVSHLQVVHYSHEYFSLNRCTCVLLVVVPLNRPENLEREFIPSGCLGRERFCGFLYVDFLTFL